MDLNWHTFKIYFYLHLIQLQTSNFPFSQLGYICKNEKNPCSRSRCYSVPTSRIREISRSYFLKHNLDISLALLIPQVCCFWPSSMELCSSKNKLKICLHFDQIRHMAPMFETRFLRLVHLCEVSENCSIRLSNDWNNFYETTAHLQPFRADKLSSLFSKTKPLRSLRLV